MDSPIRSVKVSEPGKDQISRLKRHTGLPTMNVICRWALMRSLREPTPPSPAPLPPMSNIEIAWPVFAGPYGPLILMVLRQRLIDDGLEPTDANVSEQFRLHLHRGLGYLATRELRSIEDLIALAVG